MGAGVKSTYFPQEKDPVTDHSFTESARSTAMLFLTSGEVQTSSNTNRVHNITSSDSFPIQFV